ncbi:Lrp/AsnC family transcriptional regulator [Amycolatopsis sp. AA4]|uniref:Lrp/AsnC family transcriptional regulator n=1 Tax=Actinomycetes TaxID=1760 RepID=UPI0001B54B3E|nr:MULTISPECIES: AsnC family transcriptional regulator [Actinomycetes]ATY13034.1 Lrp/AsnC family transcriptional regulator [Amycolatopsis sp. AA4]EFL08910.1 predicted protein [Streptomyces sp. AA4]
MTQNSVDELDLLIINCLQIRPRATWSVVGRVLDVDPVTVARRWERLEDAGLAWVSCYFGLPVPDRVMAYLEIEVAGAQVTEVAEQLVRHHEVVSVHHTTGARSLVASVVGPDPAAVSHYVSDSLATLDGIVATRTEIVTGKYSDAGEWRLRALSPSQRDALQAACPRPEPQPGGGPVRPDEQRIVRALAANGRMSATDLARKIGVSEATARRRLNRLIAENRATFRCEISQQVSGWPQTGILWARAPVGALDRIARELAVLPVIRACLTTTGRNNLMLFAWLRDVRELHQFERTVAQAAPEADITDRAFCLRSFKRLQLVLDDSGRTSGLPAPDKDEALQF